MRRFSQPFKSYGDWYAAQAGEGCSVVRALGSLGVDEIDVGHDNSLVSELHEERRATPLVNVTPSIRCRGRKSRLWSRLPCHEPKARSLRRLDERTKKCCTGASTYALCIALEWESFEPSFRDCDVEHGVDADEGENVNRTLIHDTSFTVNSNLSTLLRRCLIRVYLFMSRNSLYTPLNVKPLRAE